MDGELDDALEAIPSALYANASVAARARPRPRLIPVLLPAIVRAWDSVRALLYRHAARSLFDPVMPVSAVIEGPEGPRVVRRRARPIDVLESVALDLLLESPEARRALAEDVAAAARVPVEEASKMVEEALGVYRNFLSSIHEGPGRVRGDRTALHILAREHLERIDPRHGRLLMAVMDSAIVAAFAERPEEEYIRRLYGLLHRATPLLRLGREGLKRLSEERVDA